MFPFAYQFIWNSFAADVELKMTPAMLYLAVNPNCAWIFLCISCRRDFLPHPLFSVLSRFDSVVLTSCKPVSPLIITLVGGRRKQLQGGKDVI